MKLSESTVKRSENLQLTRFIAAILVLLAHNFSIVLGPPNADWLYRYTGDFSFGGVAVSIFFLCSGYLTVKSLERNSNTIEFFWSRLIRLIPALAVVIVFTLLLGIFVTDLGAKQYLSSKGAYEYLLNIFFITRHKLPGVFEALPNSSSVNGVLWTLPIEFLCYIACFIAYKIGLLKKWGMYVTIPFALAFIIGYNYVPQFFADALRPCLFFYIGMLYAVCADKISFKKSLVIIALLGLILCFAIKPLTLFGMALFFTYILFYIWFGIKQIPSRVGSIGNYSYGIYLLGFLIQQILMFIAIKLYGTLPQNRTILFIAVLIAAGLLSTLGGMLLFRFVETPMIKWGKNIKMSRKG